MAGMTALLFTLLATIMVGVGARDQMLLAGLSARQGQRFSVLAVALCSAAATSAIAAAAATLLDQRMGGKARLVLAAMALGFAAVEMLLARRRSKPAEPTHSLGALGIVLLAQQLSDSARFLIFAIAIATRAPVTAGMGGAAGSMAALTIGWLAADSLSQDRVLPLRRAIGAVLAIVAIFVAARAFGRI